MTEENAIKLFQNKKIRSAWDAKKEEWLFSVVDIIAALTDQPDPLTARKYWNKLKQRLKSEGNQTVTNCHRLKMPAADGKMRQTDCLYTEDIFRLIQSVPSKKAEPLKLWLAQVGKERIDAMVDPERSIKQALLDYKKLGYSDSWINQRLKSIEIRKDLTDEWSKHNVKQGRDFAFLTDIIYKTWAGKTTKEYKAHKSLKKENLRDNMTNEELVLNMLAELSTTSITKSRDPKTLTENATCATLGGNIAKTAREQLETATGRSVISPLSAKNLIDQKTAEINNLTPDEKSDIALILAHVEHYKNITISDATEIFSDMSRRTIQRRLKRMVDLNLLEVHGATNRLKYTLPKTTLNP